MGMGGRECTGETNSTLRAGQGLEGGATQHRAAGLKTWAGSHDGDKINTINSNH